MLRGTTAVPVNHAVTALLGPEVATDGSEEPPFTDLSTLIRRHAQQRPQAVAIHAGDDYIDYGSLDAAMDRVAAALQERGLGPGATVVICASTSIPYVAMFAGALRAGVAVAPLPPGATPAQLAAMAADTGAACVFVDAGVAGLSIPWPSTAAVLRVDKPDAQLFGMGRLVERKLRPRPVAIDPSSPFNVIYSSGTTAAPKGIVQSHAMRWEHIKRGRLAGYTPDSVTLIATPLYSNTTLVSLIPTLASGGTLLLMGKFDVTGYLRLAEQYKVTHTMLVPVQYQRLMAHADFGRYDLSAFRVKLCTGAPFHPDLKADVLSRWPGALVEYYGMTEGGGVCILEADQFPEKLHTVGRPAEGHDIRLIDEQGREVLRTPGGASGGSGEVVGRSAMMMNGYHNQPEKTADAAWFDDQGRRYVRTGDIGRFDEDGFLILHDRRKDMIISGGYNVYPSDLETVLKGHPAVLDASVIGVASIEWGETPVGFVVLRGGATELPEAIRRSVNAQLGKTQRLSSVRVLKELPRSELGKVLKRVLRDDWYRELG